MEADWNAVGSALGVLSLVVIGAWRVIQGSRKAPSAPPAERAPTQHEVRQGIEHLRDELRIVGEALRRLEQGNGALADDHREIRQRIADLSRTIDRSG